MNDILDIANVLKIKLIEVAVNIKKALNEESANFGIGVTNTDILDNTLEYTLESRIYKLKSSNIENDDEGLLISINIGFEIILDLKQLKIDIDFFKSNGIILENRIFRIKNNNELNDAKILKKAEDFVGELGKLLEIKLLSEYL